MRMKLIIATTTSLLVHGCGQVAEQAKNLRSSDAMTAEEQAANELYLEDMEDSAAEGTPEDGKDIDESVQEDTKSRRLEQMVEMMFGELDSDASGTLSLEEFLAGPEAHKGKKDLPDDAKEKMTEKLTTDFETYAGEDNELSIAELKTLLKKSAPRVGKHRQKKFPGRHKERVRQSWSQIIEKYDTDGDGKLSEDEFASLEQDRRPPPRAHGPHGQPGEEKSETEE